MKNAVFWDKKKPVRTSQEIHYVSATEPSRLRLCKILVFHGGDYEDYEEEEREKWVVVRDTTGGGNRIYHRL
jgi:hypothetical protein